MYPVPKTLKKVAELLVLVVEATAKSASPTVVLALCIESFAHGVDVPMPMRPLLLTPLTMNEGVELPVLPSHSDAVSVPCSMERRLYGEVVPTPTYPLLATMKLVPVVEPTTNCGAVLSAPVPLIESRPQGVDEPMPV